MRVDVIANVDDIRSEDFIQKSAAVIDVLRATSTMITRWPRALAACFPLKPSPKPKAKKANIPLSAENDITRRFPAFRLAIPLTIT
ncbi:2-phosphosulfolactate phosphatase [Paenibacillus sp. P1XP2]|nr:2-phosphosulfolactate phosphatase [Paenibacillus sp. P1XP2]